VRGACVTLYHVRVVGWNDVNFANTSKRNDARCTREVKPRNAMAKAAFFKEQTFHQQIGLKFE
jgi:hypothetical protein